MGRRMARYRACIFHSHEQRTASGDMLGGKELREVKPKHRTPVGGKSPESPQFPLFTGAVVSVTNEVWQKMLLEPRVTQRNSGGSVSTLCASTPSPRPQFLKRLALEVAPLLLRCHWDSTSRHYKPTRRINYDICMQK